MGEKSNQNVISPEMILLDSELSNQDDVIHYIVDNAKANHYLADEDDFYQAVKKREQEIPTAIGDLIAIPHGKTDTVQNPFIAYLRTNKAFRWTEEKEEMVQMVFLIGVPKESESQLHLKFISQLSKKLLDEEFREKLLTQTDPDKIYQQLNSIEI
ncbi:PTS sugar transporter subunit IIA [Amphibacillus sediminis]|uniref:PTS sugar transporter subunit IIA n=1 Tax=Amphibacillus sediminis TaxID=360185 RepID=UPI00082E6622|nr:PTS sugar transporter subunit IIA [Amphibacillus sediminis]